MKEIWFYDLHKTQRPESLSRLLVGKYGWNLANAGPVLAFPPNKALWLEGLPETLSTGNQIAIPWTEVRLHRQIGLAQQDIMGWSKAVKKTIRTIQTNAEEFNNTAMTLDAIVACATMVAGLGYLAVSTHKALRTVKEGLDAAKAAAEAAKIAKGLRTAGVIGGAGLYSGVKTIAGIDPGAFVGRKNTLLQVLLRHSMGLTSPSYWFSLVASAWTGDWDLWKYGSQAIDDQAIQQSLRRFTKDVMAKNLQIAAMLRQSEMSFYRYRVSTSNNRSYSFPSLPELLARSNRPSH